MSDAHKGRKWRLGTRLKLFFAGWRPRRDARGQVRLPRSFTPFGAAERVLAEFGNLRLGHTNDSVTIDPSVGEEIVEEIKRYEQVLGHRLYPIGVWTHQDRIYLVLDEIGRVYTLSFCTQHKRRFDHELRPLASSFDRAIEYLVNGSWSPREAEEDLGPLGMRGQSWRLGDAVDRNANDK
jgi:hypothetical protein